MREGVKLQGTRLMFRLSESDWQSRCSRQLTIHALLLQRLPGICGERKILMEAIGRQWLVRRD